MHGVCCGSTIRTSDVRIVSKLTYIRRSSTIGAGDRTDVGAPVSVAVAESEPVMELMSVHQYPLRSRISAAIELMSAHRGLLR